MKAQPQNQRRTLIKALAAAPVAVAAGITLEAKASSTMSNFAETFGGIWERASNITMEYARTMPTDKYDFRPTEDVRTFSEQMLHVAGSLAYFGNLIKPSQPPISDFEPADKSKQEVLSIMEQMFDYMEGIIRGMSEETLAEAVEIFGGAATVTKAEVAIIARDHMTHHRGQTTTYLRLNGMQPPRYVAF